MLKPPPPITWGDTLCRLCKVRPAECSLEGEPYCIAGGCIDAVLERWVLAGTLPRELLDALPPLEAA